MAHGHDRPDAGAVQSRGRAAIAATVITYRSRSAIRDVGKVLGLDEALLLNESGFIAEGSVSNIFFVTSSSLVTPPLESGILPGITREVVIELADTLGINVAERDVRLPDLGQFDEAFLTNSVMEIMPLVAVRDDAGQTVTIGSGKPGEVTRRLMTAYQEMVGRETG